MLLVPCVLLALAPALPAAARVVVEAVEPGAAAARAGIAPGDVLVAWSRGAEPPASPRGASGRFASFLDVDALFVDEAPRGPVTLTVERAGVRRRARLPRGDAGLDARPALATEILDVLRRARRLASARRETPRDALPSAGGRDAACWLRLRVAADLGRLRLAAPARAAWDDAVSCVAALGGPRAELRARAEAGASLKGAEDYAGAAGLLRDAAARADAAAPGSLLAAHLRHQLGVAERLRGELDAAEAAFAEARAVRERLAPKSLELGYTLNNLGIVALMRSELPRARVLCGKALAVMRHAMPGGAGEADVLNNLALIARDRGDYASADRDLARATEIRRALGPASASYASSLVNLAAVASDRGDHARADGLLEEALAILEQIAPGGLTSAHVLNNLAVSARERGDTAGAEEILGRALAIRERLAPESLEVAATLSNLGGVLEMEGRLGEARALHERALAIRQKRAPDGAEVSASLAAVGNVARARGDLAAARGFFERALALRERLGAGVALSESLADLGSVLREEGDLDRAEPLLTRALEHRARLAPASLLEAGAAHALGLLRLDRHDTAGARTLFDRALDAMDDQLGRIGGSDEGHAGFAASRDAMFKDQIDLLERTGRGEEAFGYRERARARALLAMLAGRDVDLRDAQPAALRGVADRIDADVRRIEGELPSAGDAARQERLLARLRALREQRGRLDARAALSSPRLASLRVPEPLDVVRTRASLEPGELLLAWSVLPQRTLLFVVAPPGEASGFAVRSLPVASDVLATEVALFRSLVLAGRERPGRDAALEAQARRLYDLLVAPAGPALARSRRLLLSPDGPLEELPFHALRSPDGRWLLQERPVHFALSATLHAELSRPRRGAGPGVVVFGAAETRVAPDAGSGPALVRYRRGLPPLPAAREEAESVAALFRGAATLFEGAQATEERARAATRHARIVHFAGHALLDRRHPLESGLALAGGGREDGLLQAWEVVRSVRLDADLVTLSGCETALGADAGGEGLLGLTRAFQFAGARSVLASLWSVPDRSTTRFMAAFYRAVRDGQPRDEAVRAAALELMQGDFPHPVHWAAFALSGASR